MKVRRALISVNDKLGIDNFGLGLQGRRIEIVASVGTRTELAGAGVNAIATGDVTDYPDDFLSGRVKTLQARIHAGILADRDDAMHLHELEREGIKPIDLVCVNLYGQEGIPDDVSESAIKDAISRIDIGGPVMIRTAALNFRNVAIIVDRHDYDLVLDALAEYDNGIPESLLASLAAKAFEHVAQYESFVSEWFRSHFTPDVP